jgi:hypothetical protein
MQITLSIQKGTMHPVPLNPHHSYQLQGLKEGPTSMGVQ